MPKTIHRPEYELLLLLLGKARTKVGLTQTEVSEALGKTQSYVSDIERGVRRVDVIELRDLCEVYQTDLVHLLRAFEAEVARRPMLRLRAKRVRHGRR